MRSFPYTPCLSLLVTVSTVIAGVLDTVAIHAPGHAKVHFAKQRLPFGDWTMAFHARVSRRQMRPMAKEHVGRNGIDPVPPDRPVAFGKFRELLNLGAVRLNGGGALHAY